MNAVRSDARVWTFPLARLTSIPGMMAGDTHPFGWR